MLLRRKADRVLATLIRDNRLAGQPAPLTSDEEAKRRDRRSDLTVAALGVTLGLICALFPWYIFFNPEEFGVRAMKFGGGGAGTEPILLGAQPDRIGAPVASKDIPLPDLDLLSTGSATKEHGEAGESEAINLEDQPFPPPVITFRVVQIANGRAMLEDDSGLFVVQPGSILPDNTHVRSIEERDGKPVVMTDSGEVLEIVE